MVLNTKEVLKFAAAGLCVVGTDFGVYLIAMNFVLPSIAKAISFTCGGIVGYLINKYWTFKRPKSSFWEGCKFFIANGAALGGNVWINRSILEIWPGNVYAAFAVAATATAVFTYVIFKFWVFKKSHDSVSVLKG